MSINALPALVSPARRAYQIGLLCALVGAILFSGKAIIVKLAYRYGVDAETLLALRMAFAAPFFVGAVAWSRWRHPQQRALSRQQVGQIIVVGLLGYYAASYLDFLGLRYISAALERLILFLYPTMVLLFAAWWFHKPIHRQQLWALLISYAGISLVFLHDVQLGGSTVVLGSALVFASALSYALYLVFCGQLVQEVGTLRLTAWATCVASVACIAQFFMLKNQSGISAALHLPWQVYGLSVLNAVFCTVLPVFMTMLAIQRCGAGITSQTGMVGPVATIVFGTWILGEPVTLWQLAGALVVLCGIYLLTRVKSEE